MNGLWYGSKRICEILCWSIYCCLQLFLFYISLFYSGLKTEMAICCTIGCTGCFRLPISLCRFLSWCGELCWEVCFLSSLIPFFGLQAYSPLPWCLFFDQPVFFFVPLEAPQDLILLSDPIAGFFLHQDNLVVKNDLFFSGHTASLCILFILLRHTPLRLFLLACACVVPLLIVWQRVHYSIDVLCAPPAAWVCVYVAKEISTPLFFRQKNDYNRLFSLE